jgi:hypothetical protein
MAAIAAILPELIPAHTWESAGFFHFSYDYHQIIT